MLVLATRLQHGEMLEIGRNIVLDVGVSSFDASTALSALASLFTQQRNFQEYLQLGAHRST